MYILAPLCANPLAQRGRHLVVQNRIRASQTASASIRGVATLTPDPRAHLENTRAQNRAVVSESAVRNTLSKFADIVVATANAIKFWAMDAGRFVLIFTRRSINCDFGVFFRIPNKPNRVLVCALGLLIFLLKLPNCIVVCVFYFWVLYIYIYIYETSKSRPNMRVGFLGVLMEMTRAIGIWANLVLKHIMKDIMSY